MKFTVLGLNVELRQLRGAELVESERLVALRESVLDENPWLRQDGRARFAAIGRLVDLGWTADQIGLLVRSWPSASAVTTSFVVSLAGRITEDGVDDPDEVVAWTHAMLRPKEDLVAQRDVVRAELARTGRGFPRR